ncbi:putative transposase IS891/IS1136/IS1341 family [Ktedonobacter racemifer DSM 44963]|uniref:Putative transposase IS891/IS1136/IS1341 family n=1 Tax=Ktedonobacter racemifer DSM 44963 TaxID=485913 RepID=D6U7W8_KTERA|nr:putative transposase IS891/IS1136/IS1341 family [Ktedonobacter racemifer DSM 44963]
MQGQLARRVRWGGCGNVHAERDVTRRVLTQSLQERREMYKYTGKGTTYNAQAMQLPEIKQIRQEYKDIHSQVLQDVLRRVDKAFKDFFRRVKAGVTPGYPRFQGRNHYDSFTYPQTGYSIENGRLALSKIGHVKIKLHRKVLGAIQTCTIKREGGCWYVCFSCEVGRVPRTPYTDETVGIDLGVSKLATLSTGDVIENPRYYRKAERKLEKAQQALSRKKRGSNRRKKAVERVAKLHRKVRNQRNGSLHQWSCRLVNTYETIVFEDIAPANLSRRAKPKQDEETGHYLPNGASAKSGLNKSIMDAGWSQFIAFCEYKAANAGTVQVVRVDPRYTSQGCSSCGTVRKKELSERWHSCECGCELDRDHNAARNIKALWLGRSHQEAQAS